MCRITSSVIASARTWCAILLLLAMGLLPDAARAQAV
jgi:hypothetical protein